ncbi:MAG: AAA family ATPase, partial [Gaiellales bacterium]
VTCVFARLDSAAGSLELDPEALQRELAGHHTAITTVCERHGGTVCDLRADGALVAFGVTAAREDDPLRAVRAALELVAEPLVAGGGVRAVGISSGVVVASGGAGVAEVFGRPVTEAEALARGSVGVHAAASTWRLVEHAGDGERQPDGSVHVERLADDAPAIRRQLDRPLVGRRNELDVVVQAHAQARAEQAWVVVTIAGEPGIGKSRLAAELPAALPDGTVVVTGRCPPYGEGTTFRPLRDIVLQACAGRALGDMPVVLDVPSGIVERVAALAGLGPGPAGDEAPWAVRRFLGALAREAPVAVVVDDIQWAEPGLLDLLDSVVAPPGSSPGLLVCLTR